MQETWKPLLFDKDNLNQVFRNRRYKELLQKYGYKTVADLCNVLIAQKSQWSEYVVGLPGSGKTTFALHHLWAQAIMTNDDIHNLLNLQFDKMVFVTAEVNDEIAQNAASITMIHTSPERLWLQREGRDKDIEEDQSETAFWRNPWSVAKVTTDASTIISRLKTDYADKSRIVVYKSNDPKNWDETKDISVSSLSDKRKYVEEWVVAASGKWTPAQIVHIEYQLKQVLSLSQEKWISSFAIIGWNSWGEYNLGLTQSERIKIINLVLNWKLQFITSGTPKFIKNSQGKIIKILPEKSWAVLGKERLPSWFTQWSYEDLLRDYPHFSKHKDAYAVKAFAWYNFLNIWDIPMQWSEESISATFIRKCLVEGNIDAIEPYLSPEIFSILTSSHNLGVLQRRYLLIQERDEKLVENKKIWMEKYKQIDPITKKPLLNKKWILVSLTKKYVDKYDNRRDQAKFMTYFQWIDQLLKKTEKVIKKKYNKLIYSPENTLIFK